MPPPESRNMDKAETRFSKSSTFLHDCRGTVMGVGNQVGTNCGRVDHCSRNLNLEKDFLSSTVHVYHLEIFMHEESIHAANPWRNQFLLRNQCLGIVHQ